MSLAEETALLLKVEEVLELSQRRDVALLRSLAASSLRPTDSLRAAERVALLSESICCEQITLSSAAGIESNYLCTESAESEGQMPDKYRKGGCFIAETPHDSEFHVPQYYKSPLCSRTELSLPTQRMRTILLPGATSLSVPILIFHPSEKIQRGSRGIICWNFETVERDIGTIK